MPKLTVESADGKTVYGGLPDCAEPLLPSAGGALPALGLNERVNAVDYPDAVKADFPTAAYPPKSLVFYGLAGAGTDIINNNNNNDKPAPGCTSVSALDAGACERRAPPVPGASIGSGGFLNNLHNAYTTTAFSRRFGNIAIVISDDADRPKNTTRQNALT